MENASKALIIAGGILIAIVLIAAFATSLSTVKKFQISQLSQEEQDELLTFNEQYTKYVGQYVYETEVITLKNKYDNDGLVEVEVEIDGDNPVQDENKYNYNNINWSNSNETRYYKCTKVDYDENTGKIYKIYFTQIKLSADT